MTDKNTTVKPIAPAKEADPKLKEAVVKKHGKDKVTVLKHGTIVVSH